MRASSALERLERFREGRMQVLSQHYSRRKRVPAIFHPVMDNRRLHYPVVVVHAIPMAAIRGTSGPLDTRHLLSRWSDFKLLRLGITNTSRRFNHLGLLISDSEDRVARTQIFRDGRIEQAMSLTRTTDTEQTQDGTHVEKVKATFDLPLAYMESQIVQTARANMDVIGDFDISPPFLVGISLLRSDQLGLVVGEAGFQDDALPCEAEEIHCDLSEVHTSEELDIGLRNAFDHIWNAYGFSSSPSYDDQGRLRV